MEPFHRGAMAGPTQVLLQTLICYFYVPGPRVADSPSKQQSTITHLFERGHCNLVEAPK